jgi:hypothetical protein
MVKWPAFGVWQVRRRTVGPPGRHLGDGAGCSGAWSVSGIAEDPTDAITSRIHAARTKEVPTADTTEF